MRRIYTPDSKTNIQQIDAQIQHLSRQKGSYIQKALQSPTNALDFVGLNPYIQKNKPQEGQRKSLIIDPFERETGQGYLDKPTTVSFELLERMSHAPIIRAIINTRKDQVAEFVHPQKDKYSKGYVIQKKVIPGITEEDQELTDDEKREVEQIIKFLENAGDDENKWKGDDFESFTRKIIEDSLALDQYCFEIIRYNDGSLAEMIAVDAQSIRIAQTFDEMYLEDPAYQEYIIDGHLPSHVQIYQNRIWTEFYPWELAVGVRNPSTNLRQLGYGRSELEDMIQTVTAMLNADSYNANFFKNGSAPKGMMLIKKAGGINSDVLNEFRADWQAQMAGVNNMHKTPALDAEHVEWLDLQKSNKDMEFYKYQEYLIKLACAIYKISPEEVGFPLEGTNSGGLNSSGGGNKDELDYSREKGLAPLLRNYEKHLNKFVVGPMSNNKYQIKFVGINAETEQEEEDRILKATGGPYMEINEAREVRGLETKPEYDTLAPLLGGGDQQSDAFMDAAMGGGDNQGQGFQDDFDETGSEQESDVEKGDNPMWNKFENWFMDNLAAA